MPRPARPNRPATEPPAESGVSQAWLFIMGLLLAARYLQPTEAVVFGETLWQAQLWITAAAVWCWFAWRNGTVTLRLSLLDAGLWLLAIGHGLSTIPVFVEGGDRRAAVNVVWEWVGLAATLFLVRQILPRPEFRRLPALFTTMMIALASLGIWQHHVSFPQTASQYDELATEESTLAGRLAGGLATGEERTRLAEVRRELAASGVPTDEATRRQWVNRVKFSTEPFATFGLANTLGGLLAAAVLILLARLWPPRRTAVFAGLVAALSVLFYCLVLTKSRTAWVGLAAGGFAAVGLRSLAGRLEKRLVYATAGLVAAGLLIGLGVLATGGLDRQVFSEAPKSLRYRLDYWSGALGVLAERPLLGTGPANFRAYYLEHRPLGASEEIAAPHNLFLDVWAAGGLLSLAVLVGMISYVAVRLILDRSGPPDRSDEPAENEPPPSWSGLESGMLAAFPLIVFVYFVSGAGIDWRLVAIWPVAAGAALCLIRSNGDTAAFAGPGAGFLALVVHLLGADGIEFPAVVQSLLLLSLVADRSREFSCRSPRGGLVPVVSFGTLTIGCLLTGLVPVLNGSALIARAESAMLEGDAAADRLLADAIETDPLATRPVSLRAELATSRALGTRSARDLKTARQRWQEVLDLEPRSIHARQRLAELLLEQRNENDALRAVRLLDEAVRLSPTDAELRLRLAKGLRSAGQPEPAAEQAALAIRIDDVNHAAGHYDLVFDDATRTELERIAAVGKRVPAP